MNDYLNTNFLETLITIVIQILTAITNIILLPFNLLIGAYFPDLSGALDNISALFDLAGTYIGWVLSFLGVPAILLTLVLAYYLFTITVTLGVWGVKLALKWIGHLT